MSTYSIWLNKVRRVLEFAAMRKDTRFTLRIPSDLKKEMEIIAAREGRSVAQVCEAFLKAGSENYKKKGSGYLQRFLAQSLSGPRDS
jgi:predicted HicB family RNase H-like nuclease